MKVILPSLNEQKVYLVPRHYPTTQLDLTIILEATNASQEFLDVSYSINNGILDFLLQGTYPNNNKYQITLKESGVVVYRGKMISTDQTPEDYKITKDTYVY